MTPRRVAAPGVRWDRVDALIDASPSLRDLRAHGLQLLAARRWRVIGRRLEGDLAHEDMQAMWRTEAVPRVLAAIRAATAEPVIVVKGPMAAARYPDPAARPFIDLDVIVEDAPRVQAALLAAGFQHSADPAGYPDFLHHLPPVHWPADPIPIEVHSRLKWVEGLQQPSFATLAGAAEDGALGVAGMLALPPEHHALVLAGHLWAHDPLARALRVLDVALMADAADPRRLQELAREWRMERLWRTTVAVARELFGDGGADAAAWPLRTWARGLREAREPSVSELHLSRVLSPFAIYPPAGTVRALGSAVAGFARPHDGEPWRVKFARTARQIAHPSMRRSDHVEAIEVSRRKNGSH